MRKKRLLLLVILGIACFSLAAKQIVRAAEPSPSQGIQVSPVVVDLNADKGNSYNLKITVTNVTTGQLTLSSAVNDFRAKDETGNPEVILNDQEIDPSSSFRSWVKPLPNLNLKPKESRTVTVDVTIPPDADAGGHYGVIRFSGFPPGTENNNVSISASVGVLLLARVSGAITENLSVKEIFVEKAGRRQGLLETGPFSLIERIENTGNVHVKPTGKITIKNMFGNVIASPAISDPAKNILPRSTRRFSQDVSQKWLFGRYTARLDLAYGYTGKVLTGTYTFWVIPYRLIGVIVLVVVLIVCSVKFSLKRYKKRILRQVNKQSKR